MIKWEDITVSFNGINLFKNISGEVYPGDRVGLIGENGIGKTTLLKVIIGKLECEKGSVVRPNNISYMRQYDLFDNRNKVRDYVNIDILKKLGIDSNILDKRLSDLSGGEQTIIHLAIALQESSGYLVLDEPTNHLDMDYLYHLEEMLKSSDDTMLIVSHDRYFLDKVCTKIYEFTRSGLKEYKGNYTAYKKQKEIEKKEQKRTYHKQTRQIEHLKDNINDRKNWYNSAHKAAGTNDFLRRKAKKHVSQMKNKMKQLERLESEKIDKPRERDIAAFNIIKKNLAKNKKLPKFLIRVQNFSKSFDDLILFEKVNIAIKKNTKTAIIGPNGSGKTTLIRCILGKIKISSGSIEVNPSVKIGYYSQLFKEINFNNSILDEVYNDNYTQTEIRIMLGSLLFKREDVNKRIKDLSLGEKSRVAMAKFLLSGCDMLILDEPTNYLDIESREALEKVLKDFKGSLLFVSHDRYFIENVADNIIEIKDRKVIDHQGNFLANEPVNMSINDQEILKLELELANLSNKILDLSLNDEDKLEIDKKIIETMKKIKDLKS